MKKYLLFVLLFAAPFLFAAEPLERVVITFNKDGTLRGVSATNFADAPVPLDQSGITAILPKLNAAALARVAVVEPELTAAQARVEAIVAALKGVDPKTLPAPVQAALMTKAQADKAALLAKKAEIEAALAKVAP